MRLYILIIGLMISTQASSQEYKIYEIKKYLAANADRLDAIEGVWKRSISIDAMKKNNQKFLMPDTLHFEKPSAYMIVFKKNNCYVAADFNNETEVVKEGCSLSETQDPDKYIRTTSYYNNSNIPLVIEKGEIRCSFNYKPLYRTNISENDSFASVHFIENYKRVYPTESEIHLAQQTNPEHFLEEGIKRFKKKEYSNAIQFLSKAIRLNSDLTDAYYLRAGSFYAIKDFSHALADINIAARQKSSSADFYSLKGSINLDLKNYNQAIADFSKGIELKPANALLYYNRSIAEYNINDFEKAVLDCNKAIELSPTAVFYNQRAWYLFKTGNLKMALADASSAINLNPVDANSFDTRGCIYFANKQYSQALFDFNRAIKLNPDLGNSYLYRGRIKLLMEQKTEACKDWGIAALLGESEANEYNKKKCR